MRTIPHILNATAIRAAADAAPNDVFAIARAVSMAIHGTPKCDDAVAGAVLDAMTGSVL